MTRPGWDDYFLGIAVAVAARADCTRRQVGAVIVKDHRIVATGYNGAPAGRPGCASAGACPRGRHFASLAGTMCYCGHAWPCPAHVDPGSSYDTGPGSCIALHAEANSLLYASRDACEGATMYVTCEPCYGCLRLIRGAGIVRMKSPELEWSTAL